MNWSTEDIKKWKALFAEKSGKKVRSEKAIYPLLASWIKSQRSKSKVYFGGMQGPYLIDVVEMNEKEELTGYEVKMAHVGKKNSERSIQTTYIIQGIGQALEYLCYGMDYSYLVAPEVMMLKQHLTYMLEEMTPLGLVLFDRSFNFMEVLRAKKTQIYSQSVRKPLSSFTSGKASKN